MDGDKMKLKDLLKPAGKLKISKVFINKKNGQMSIVLPKKKIKNRGEDYIPTRFEVSYW